MNAKIDYKPINKSVYIKLWLINAKLAIENKALEFFRGLLFKTPKTYKRILVFRTGSLGDSINAIPSIQAVNDAFPAARIDILTNAGEKNLVGLRYLIQRDLYNELIDYNEFPKRKLFFLLKQKKYDLVIQLPQVDASFSRLLRDLIIFSRIATAGAGWFTTQTKWFRKMQSKYLLFQNENERLSGYLKKNGFVVKNPNPQLEISSSDLSHVKNLIANSNFNPEKKRIAIVIGAKRPQNRWPIKYFKKVIQHFSEHCIIILIGSTEDQILAAPLFEIPGVVSFCGKLTPMQSAAMISVCDLTLSNDTGPMHMSYAVKTPTIALFSSRDLPGKWYPPKENNMVFRAKGIQCEACFSETCGNNICMQAIKPEEVIAAAKKVISM